MTRTTGLEFIDKEDLRREIEAARYWFRRTETQKAYWRKRLFLALLERNRRRVDSGNHCSGHYPYGSSDR